jgi:hypothetical protein
MAWEACYTSEGYAAVLENLERRPVEYLEEVYACWIACLAAEDNIGRHIGDTDFNNSAFDQTMYERALKDASRCDKEALAHEIWRWAAELNTCDNGGHNMWVSPDGHYTEKPNTPEEEDEHGQA